MRLIYITQPMLDSAIGNKKSWSYRVNAARAWDEVLKKPEIDKSREVATVKLCFCETNRMIEKIIMMEIT